MRMVLLGSALLVAACGGTATTPPPTIIPGTPTVVAQSLQVMLAGQPVRSFGFGRWHVCDHGTVTNPSTVVARGVRLTVTYYNHGAVDGQTTLADAPSDGGALGDIAACASKPFTICGYARNEPDRDVVTATLAA
jgi:hypothetical protein